MRQDYIFCHHCGKRIPAKSVKCPYCGAKVSRYDKGLPKSVKPSRPVIKPRRSLVQPQYRQYNFYKKDNKDPGANNICVRHSTATIVINVLLLIGGVFLLGWPSGIIVAVTGSMLKKSAKTYTAGSIFFILGLIWIGLGAISSILFIVAAF